MTSSARTERPVSAWVLPCVLAMAFGFAAAPSLAQGLERFKASEPRDERLAINRAVRQCVRLLQEKTAPARVSVTGPCRKPSGDWAGVDRLEPGYRLRFSVTPAGASAGTLLSAIEGDSVRVFCTADAEGAVTQFEDVKEGLRESFSSASLCWPAGD
ncbi:MAG: hypothetical protein JWQ88_903 [Rhodoferax sp.]|nr:hypothetical protein [Rhodoferax sp.]